MAKILVLFLILLDAISVLAAAHSIEEAPARKLGNHQNHLSQTPSTAAPSMSPSEAPHDHHQTSERNANNAHASGEEMGSPDQNSTSDEALPEKEIYLEKHQHHSSIDKSVAGGGVILGGLATAFLVSVFCYIRATRRNQAKPSPVTP